jgi:hypothetical protein
MKKLVHYLAVAVLAALVFACADPETEVVRVPKDEVGPDTNQPIPLGGVIVEDIATLKRELAGTENLISMLSVRS